MRKFITMSVPIFIFMLPFMMSKSPSPQKGLSRMVFATLTFLVVWALVGPPLFFMFSAD